MSFCFFETPFMHRLNARHLHCFWSVAKEGHLTRAADQGYLSQSTMSAQIRQLEGQIGQTLFTQEGRALLTRPPPAITAETRPRTRRGPVPKRKAPDAPSAR